MKFWPIIGFFLVQTGGGVWWASAINSDVERLKESKVEIAAAVKDLPDIKASLKSIERDLARLTRSSAQ